MAYIKHEAPRLIFTAESVHVKVYEWSRLEENGQLAQAVGYAERDADDESFVHACYGIWVDGEPGSDDLSEEPTEDQLRAAVAQAAADDAEVKAEIRRERAMLAGMEGGCDAYNDAMGYGPAED